MVFNESDLNTVNSTSSCFHNAGGDLGSAKNLDDNNGTSDLFSANNELKNIIIQYMYNSYMSTNIKAYNVIK